MECVEQLLQRGGRLAQQLHLVISEAAVVMEVGGARECRRQFFGVTIGTPVAVELKYQLRAYVGGL